MLAPSGELPFTAVKGETRAAQRRHQRLLPRDVGEIVPEGKRNRCVSADTYQSELFTKIPVLARCHVRSANQLVRLWE